VPPSKVVSAGEEDPTGEYCVPSCWCRVEEGDVNDMTGPSRTVERDRFGTNVGELARDDVGDDIHVCMLGRVAVGEGAK